MSGPWRWRRPLTAIACVLALTAAAVAVARIRHWYGIADDSPAGRAALLAAVAADLRDQDPGLAARLDVAAYLTAPGPDTASDLYGWLGRPVDATAGTLTQPIVRVAGQPDGRLTAALAENGTVAVWAGGVRAATLTTGKVGIALAPYAPLLAAGCPDGTRAPCLWDLTDPHRPTVLAPLPLPPALAGGAHLSGMAVSTGGDLLAAASQRGPVLLWSIARPTAPRLLADLPGPPDPGTRVAAVAFGGHDRLLAATVDGGATRLWRLPGSGTPQSPGPDAARSPAAKPLADLDSGGQSVTVGPDGHWLATAGSGGLHIWSVTDPGTPVPVDVPETHGAPYGAVAASPDGTTLAYAAADSDRSNASGQFCLLRLAPGDPALGTTTAHCTRTGYGMISATYRSDGTVLAGGFDGTLRRWRLPVPWLPERATRDPYLWDADPAGRLLALPSRTHEATVDLWDVGGPDPRLVGSVPGGTTRTTFLDAGTLLTVDPAGTVRLWDVTDPRHPRAGTALATTSPTIALGWPPASAIGSGGQAIAILGDDRRLHLWRRDGARAVETATLPVPDHVTGPPTLLPDGRTLMVPADSGISWYRLTAAGPRAQGSTPLPAPFLSQVYATSDILAIATATTSDGPTTTTLYGLPGDARPTPAVLPGPVSQVDENTDRDLLASAANGPDTLTLWSVRDPAHPRRLATVPAVPEPAGLAFGPSGTRLAVWSNSTLRLWDTRDAGAPALVAAIPADLPGVTPAVPVGGWVSRGVVYARSGGALVLAENDGYLLADTDPRDLAAHLCTTTAGTLTAALWRRYVPVLPYRDPCP